MPKNPNPPIKGKLKRWSYSLWTGYSKCRYQAALSYLVPKSDAPRAKIPAIERGNEIHKLCENYLKGEITGIPKPMQKFKEEFIQLKEARPMVEEWWNFNDDFEPVGNYKGSLVLKSDAVVPPRKRLPVLNIDFKTGREYDDHDDQAELSAIATKQIFKDSKGVEFEFWYLDSGESAQYEFTDEQLEEGRERWSERAKQMLANQTFMPEPSPEACGRCFHRSDKGGVCHAWKKNHG